MTFHIFISFLPVYRLMICYVILVKATKSTATVQQGDQRMDQKRCNAVTKTMQIGKTQGEVTQHPMGETGTKWWEKKITTQRVKKSSFSSKGTNR